MAAFRGWDVAVLRTGGWPVTRENLRALNAWQRAEGGSAAFNPLNTTQPAPGASSYNGVGVRNFTSPQQGIQATVQTLKNGHYGNIIGLLGSGKATADQIATAVEHSPWGTGGGVLRVLGSKAVPIPGNLGPAAPRPKAAAPSLGSGLGSGLSDQAVRSMTAAYMLQQSAATAAGAPPDSSGLVALAIARQQAHAAQQTYGPQPVAKGGLTGAPLSAGTGLAIPVEGTVGREDPHFLSALTAAARARGAVKIVATSGERSVEHNAAIGGASHSNHLPDAHGFGHAMDGYAVLPNGSRVPLGQFLLQTAGKFGLRSGASFNWAGKPDVVHVDDGSNQR